MVREGASELATTVGRVLQHGVHAEREALPIYSGGLGNVAGDQLKAANDLGVPVAAVGLLYQQGYFRQEIDEHGVQRALYPYNDPGQLPNPAVAEGERRVVAHADHAARSQPVDSHRGACRSAIRRYIFSTATTRPIRRPTAVSPVSCTAEGPSCAFARSRFWESWDGDCCARWDCSRRSAI